MITKYSAGDDSRDQTTARPGWRSLASKLFHFGPESPLGRLGAGIQRRPGAGLLLIAVVLAIQVSPWLYGSEDATFYMSVARSMVNEGRMETFDNPSMKVLPGYPLLIAPTFALSSHPFLFIAIEHWILAIIGTVGIYLWARRVCPEAAVLVTILSVLNATFTYYYRRPLKEVAYLAALVWLVNVLHWLIDEQSRRKIVWLSLAATCLLALASLIRYSAMTVVPMFCLVLLYLAWQHRITWKRAAAITLLVAGPATLAVAAYLVHEEAVARRPTDGTYLRAMQAALGHPKLTEAEGSTGSNRYWIGFKLKLSEIWRATVPGAFKDTADIGPSVTFITVVRLFFAVLIGVGWWRLQRRRFDLLALMFPCYLIVYLPLACDQGARLMIPYLPLLMACLWFAAEGRTWRPGAITFVCAAQLAISVGYWATIDAPLAYRVHQQWDAMQQIADSIPTDRNLVAMPSRDKARFSLEFALDRQVIPISDMKHWKERTDRCEWMVLPAHTEPSPGDHIHSQAQGYVVLDIGKPHTATRVPSQLTSRPDRTVTGR